MLFECCCSTHSSVTNTSRPYPQRTRDPNCVGSGFGPRKPGPRHSRWKQSKYLSSQAGMAAERFTKPSCGVGGKIAFSPPHTAQKSVPKDMRPARGSGPVSRVAGLWVQSGSGPSPTLHRGFQMDRGSVEHWLAAWITAMQCFCHVYGLLHLALPLSCSLTGPINVPCEI